MKRLVVEIIILIAAVLIGSTIIMGFARWRDQRWVCTLGRALGGAVLGVLLRMVIISVIN